MVTLLLPLFLGCAGNIDNPREFPYRLEVLTELGDAASYVEPYLDRNHNEMRLLVVCFNENQGERYLDIRSLDGSYTHQRFNLPLAELSGSATPTGISWCTLGYSPLEENGGIAGCFTLADSESIGLYRIRFPSGEIDQVYEVVRTPEREPFTGWDISINGLRPIESPDPGLPDYYAQVQTGALCDAPREWIAFDAGPLPRKRFSLVTGSPLRYAFSADLSGDDRRELVFGSSAPCNNKRQGGFSDNLAYYAAFRSDGSLLWSTPTPAGGGVTTLHLEQNPLTLYGIRNFNNLADTTAYFAVHRLDPATGVILASATYPGMGFWTEFLNPDDQRWILLINSQENTFQYYNRDLQPFGKAVHLPTLKTFAGLFYPWGTPGKPVFQFLMENQTAALLDRDLTVIGVNDKELFNQQTFDRVWDSLGSHERFYPAKDWNGRLYMVRIVRAQWYEWISARYKWPIIILLGLLSLVPAVFFLAKYLKKRFELTVAKKQQSIIAKHQAHLKAIFEGIKGGLAAIGENLVITRANREFQSLFNLPPGGSLEQVPLGEVLPGQMGPITRVAREAFRTGQDIDAFQVRIEIPSVGTRILQISCSHLDGSSSPARELLLYLRDITWLFNLERTVEHREGMGDLVGASLPMQLLYKQIEKVAPTDKTVLITGETGTGKDLVAHAIHENSNRRNRPFILVNTVAIPANLLESDLFGTTRGGFTGATSRGGYFEKASGGTLFLDEIGDLPLDLQVKLLRAVECGEIQKVGAAETTKVDVRIIAATNQNLKRLVEEGRFRMDLYYRLCVIEIEVPPLRAHREDIPLLIDHFLAREGDSVRISPEARERLLTYPWPGNVRELKNALGDAALHCKDGTISLADLRDEIARYTPASGPSGKQKKAWSRQTLYTALEKHGWVVKQAAGELGISRQHLHALCNKYGIHIGRERKAWKRNPA